jgi:putative restriction endonuclease
MQTSVNSPYGDAPSEAGFRYAYRTGSPDQADNRALRWAFELRVPVVYFVATRPGWYDALYPCFVTADDPAAREVLVSVGAMAGPMDEPEPISLDDPIVRAYAFRQARVRLHQERFRARVIPAYRDQCAVCRLKEVRLLDAAHIVGDAESAGEPTVANGLSLCSIHHRAFDRDLVGIAPDYSVHVARRLLDVEDGPMLDTLKHADGVPLHVPRATAAKPDRDLLAMRFERFRTAA